MIGTVGNYPAGLCETCGQARRIENDRGSVFYWCGRSKEDPRFPKYPHLPVRQCPGYVAVDDSRDND